MHDPTPTLITVSAYGYAGPSSRVRVYDWLRHLGVPSTNHDYLGAADASFRRIVSRPGATLRAEFGLRRLGGRLPAATLLLSRTATPLTTGALEVGLLRAARRGVYDFDDALYADRRGGVHRIFGKPRAWSRAVAAADVVVAGNATLAEAAREHNDAVVVVPSCVEPGDYVAKDRYDIDGRPNLVWVGSPATEQYLAHLAPALARLHETHGAVVTVVSRGNRPFPGMDHVVRRVDWSPAAVRAQLSRADVALAPLVDDEFTRGKCAYKLLQYGAAGVPVVGSPVGVNRTVLQDLGGFPAEGLEQWCERVEDVLGLTPVARAELGRRGRAAVADKYSYGAWAPVFWQILFPDLPWSAPAGGGTSPVHKHPGDER
ncbi:glycosyltransferase [Blastococcus deserti]|uniref:Glycosyltransferase n=1 Tax=Blastococcus deserti TaxID=2259033 RepID=A0ABW4XCU4_9ACTN